MVISWHDKHRGWEPTCGSEQWRQKDRWAIINICDMHDRHLEHCIRFAMTKRQHADKLQALLHEKFKRELMNEKYDEAGFQTELQHRLQLSLQSSRKELTYDP